VRGGRRRRGTGGGACVRSLGPAVVCTRRPSTSVKSRLRSSSAGERDPLWASWAATRCGLCCALFATWGGRSGGGRERAQSSVQMDTVRVSAARQQSVQGRAGSVSGLRLARARANGATIGTHKRPVRARPCWGGAVRQTRRNRKRQPQWSMAKELRAAFWSQARKQIERWSSTLSSTSQGPWAEPARWRARGPPRRLLLDNQRRANGWASTEVPLPRSGVPLCYARWGKAALAGSELLGSRANGRA
jgi:hypothetical protein